MRTSTIRQAAHDTIRPQTRAVAAEINTASNNFPLSSNLQISVGDAGYSRQVDTDPVGIDIGDFTIHTVSGMQCVCMYVCRCVHIHELHGQQNSLPLQIDWILRIWLDSDHIMIFVRKCIGS